MWGPHCNSARPIPPTPSDKNVPSTNQPPNASSVSLWKVTEETLLADMKVPQTSPVNTVFLQVRYIHKFFYLNNLLCVLNLRFHMYYYLRLRWKERRIDLKKNIFKNKFRYSVMWQESRCWCPQGWETLGSTWARRPTPAAPVSTRSEVGVGYHMEGNYSALGAFCHHLV